MTRRLPSLNQLRAFEAAARHGSFKLAAAELCVTPAAVSHQVKALEAALGIQLFHRAIREVRLTERAKAYLATLTGAFDAIAAATAQLADAGMGGVLRISAPPFFGDRWLLPRLPRFRERCPALDVQVSLSVDMVDLTRSDLDAALRFGEGPWPHLASVLIAADVVGPVCAPRHVAGRALPLDAREIGRMKLATVKGRVRDWLDWFAAADAPPPNTLRTVDHDSSAFAFDAALAGNAVCLADVLLTASDEAGGTLVRLHPRTLARPRGIHLVHRQTPFPDPRLTALADWLREEASVGGTSAEGHLLASRDVNLC
jgi:LysR family transcriptional regulator, glycine cleavage system transcriptional activator